MMLVVVVMMVMLMIAMVMVIVDGDDDGDGCHDGDDDEVMVIVLGMMLIHVMPNHIFVMALLRVLCWALIFILRLRFPPGSSIASIMPSG
jgi:hypothetical protein